MTSLMQKYSCYSLMNPQCVTPVSTLHVQPVITLRWNDLCASVAPRPRTGDEGLCHLRMCLRTL